MKTLNPTTNIVNKAKGYLADSRILENPYLSKLKDGTMSRQQFQESQEQFYHAVRFFAQPMALLVSRIPDPAARLSIVHNIVEEHGDFEPKQFHEATFRDFLSSIGQSGEPRPPGPAVLAFNYVLSGVCGQESLPAAICTLGMIEFAFAEISSLIGEAVVNRGWVTIDALVHYKLHAEIDLRHAAEFFEIAETHWPEAEEQMTRGLSLGIFVFDRLYLDLERGSRDRTCVQPQGS